MSVTYSLGPTSATEVEIIPEWNYENGEAMDRSVMRSKKGKLYISPYQTTQSRISPICVRISLNSNIQSTPQIHCLSILLLIKKAIWQALQYRQAADKTKGCDFF